MSAILIGFPSSDAFTAFEYPGGESQVRINKDFLEPLRTADKIVIVAKVRSAQDLIRLILLSDAIYGWCLKQQFLRIAYLPYARADRRFVHGDCAGLQTFGRILGAGYFQEVITQDVHSAKAYDYIPRLTGLQPIRCILEAIRLIESEHGSGGTVLLPDDGAVSRYKDALPWPVLTCTKKRDPSTGALLEFIVPEPEAFGSGSILIVDDICDGGGTFVGIAEKLAGSNLRFLYVTHGIFSKGYGRLEARFRQIFTTDSVTPVFEHPVDGLVTVLGAIE